MCTRCLRDMQKQVSCVKTFVKVDIPKQRRLVAERYDGHDGNNCHDCGTPNGGYHHLHCDMEVCPQCNGQLLGFDCGCYRR